MRLTNNFALDEFLVSQEASRRRIDNTPTDAIVTALHFTAQLLEQVRFLLRTPILVTSGYRSPALNAAIGGVPDSAHTEGRAADFHAPGFGSVDAVWRAIADSSITFDQCIREYGSWVHIAWSPTQRRQVFAID